MVVLVTFKNEEHPVINESAIFPIIYLVQKETQYFYLHFLGGGGGGVKIIDFKTCFDSVVLPSNKYFDNLVLSLVGYRALFRE